MIIKLAESNLKTRFGEYRELLYYDGRKESIALTMGEIEGAEDVLCRIRSSCLYGHIFNSIECDCREQMENSQRLIQEAAKGIIIWLDQEGKGNGHYALMKSAPFKRSGLSQSEAYQAAGFSSDARSFQTAAEMLKDLGALSVRLLTDNPQKVKSVTQHGIRVCGIQEITPKSSC